MKKTTYVLHVPSGLCLKDFEAKKDKLEHAFKGKITFGYNGGNVIMTVAEELGTEYPFEFEPCKKPLELFCGYSDKGKFILDIEKCPHAIAAGETGSGKTSLLDIIILSLIMNKFRVEIRLIDFQAVGLGKYEDCKKVKSYGETPEDFEMLMSELESENDRRIKLFRSVKNTVYIDKLSVWNKRFPDRYMPPIVVIIDEFSRLAEDKYKPILERFRTCSSMARKVGIHIIIAMQRPDVKCIEGSIKANFVTRIAGKTVTDTDSEVILDQPGAEKLKNSGRFLMKYCGELTEMQSMYIPSEKVQDFLKQNNLYKSNEEIEKASAEKTKVIEERNKQMEEDYEKEKELERQQAIDNFHKKYQNPYKKVNKNDNEARPRVV